LKDIRGHLVVVCIPALSNTQIDTEENMTPTTKRFVA
jgi:hypothetical protein